MQSTVEQLEGNKVKVEVTIDATSFEQDIDVAYRKLARQVRIPGFRPGKAPRRIIDAHLGVEGKKAARAQAIEDAVPKYLAEAVKQHDIDIIATPKVDHVHGAEDAYKGKLGIRGVKDPVEIRDLMLRAIEDGRVPEKDSQWPTAYAARRIAWHVLDHAWELIDRST